MTLHPQQPPHYRAPAAARPPEESAGKSPARTIALRAFGHAGREAVDRLVPAPHPSSRRAARQRLSTLRRSLQATFRASETDLHQAWLSDNARLLTTAERDVREFVDGVARHPAVTSPSLPGVPRVTALAESYLDLVAGQFSDDSFVAFLGGVQESRELLMRELWATKPALMLALLERIVAAANDSRVDLPELVTSVRALAESNWRDVFEATSVVDRALRRDAARAYARMDYESRDLYRTAVSELAEHSRPSEREIAETAVQLGAVLSHPLAFYLGGIAAVTLGIVAWFLPGADIPGLAVVLVALLAIPATQVAVEFLNNLAISLVRPRRLAKLDFSARIPDDCATLVAVPSLLLSESHVHELVMDLEIRYLANRDANLFFALITDGPDSMSPIEERDDLVKTCAGLIHGLNRRYGTPGRTPFYLFHRYREFNASEGRWMGWERKRGKILDLNRLLRGEPDRFPIKVGDPQVLSRIRYVLTLDADTQLPRDAAHRLVGAMAHPLNRAVLDPATRRVMEGYGILQPRIGISTLSASRSWLARLLSGETGFDIYTRAVSDVYQDLFGEGSFTGKGIYDVDAFRAALEDRFPENALLSHDLVEGLFARAGLVSDVELIDDYPTHFSAYSRRKHRWMRGDWQILRWLTSRVPDGSGTLIPNDLSAISRWKILDNLRRSLFEPATLLLLLGGWFVLPGSAHVWTVVSLALLLMPTYAHLLFSALQAPWGRKDMVVWVRDRIRAFGRAHLLVGLHLAFLLHDALLAIDAIVRSLARVFVTRQKLLEWETAAEAEARARPKGAADRYLDWSPLVSAALALVMVVAAPESLPAAAPVLTFWMLAGALAGWLGLAPRTVRLDLADEDVRHLRGSALKIWRFFREFSTFRVNWLVPDYVRADGGMAERISPTNLGFLLNARIAAVHLGYLTISEFARDTECTLAAALRLPRHRGHFFNWSATDRPRALDPLFVSTVDSGNLAACLWTLKQAATAFRRQPPEAGVLWDGIRDIARLVGEGADPGAHALADGILRAGKDWEATLPELGDLARHYAESASGETEWWAHELVTRIDEARAWLDDGLTDEVRASLEAIAAQADRLVADMDFSFLYDLRKKVLSIGYDAGSGRLEPSTYDLLASESRIASFVSIAKGDVPQDSWFHLGRSHLLADGERVLASWTGTMFEYLMPVLWMRHHPHTIIHNSMRAVVRLQQKFARWRSMPWGFSESGCLGPDPAHYGYAAFGLPELALKTLDARALVVSPYSTYLSLLVDARAAMSNLRRMDRLGWTGVYGPYEAVDYSTGTPRVVRSWMAHHQGMSLLAVSNLLCQNVLQDYFHAEPHVLATELLLHERVPHASLSNAQKNLVPMPVAEGSVA
ncbi:MAG: glycosyl transferase [Acidobacteria bacterium]|nr:glycosyl transferase [Acidobacteriota bacterium]